MRVAGRGERYPTRGTSGAKVWLPNAGVHGAWLQGEIVWGETGKGTQSRPGPALEGLEKPAQRLSCRKCGPRASCCLSVIPT